MRKFLFDVILGIFIGISACVVGIIALFGILDNFKEIRDNIIADIKDFIHELLYGYHHNRSAGDNYTNYSSYSTRDFSYSTTNNYKSIYGWWNSTRRNDTDIKAESECPKEDDEEKSENAD